jgi:hypothetical protein
MGGLQNGVRLARLFYLVVAVIAFILAVGVVAPALTGGSGVCQVVLNIGAPAPVGLPEANPLPQASPGPALPGAPSACAQYVGVAPALIAVVLGAILLLTVIRLGREPSSWGLMIALGAIAGILAALGAGYAVLGVASSDQPQATPGLASIFIAAVLVLAAIGSAFVLWRAAVDQRRGPLGEACSPILCRRAAIEEATMNSIVREYLSATFFREYQALRDQLMEILTDDDLDYRVGAPGASLGALCREIGDIEHSYIESFRTFRQDFEYQNPDERLARSVAALSLWYQELDQELMAAIEDLSEDDIANRRIIRGDFDVAYFSPLPKVQLDIYREALLIFYGKASVYLKAIGTPLPQQWQDWIG